MSAAGISSVPPDCTVCICTRNRVRYLGPTIEAALEQELPNGRFEILVVDNGSTDGTSGMVAERFGAGTRAPVRCIREETPGLSRARNRAIAETGGDILVFLDDDAIPEPGWLAWILDAFASSPRVAAVGGTVIPVYESGKPDWLPERFEAIFSPQVKGPDRRRVFFPEYPYGANVAFRRRVFQTAGLFREDLGYCGTNLLSSEDREFLMRLEKSDEVILWEPRAVVRHLIPASRTAKPYLRRRAYEGQTGRYGIEKTRRGDFEDWGFREIAEAMARWVRESLRLGAGILWHRLDRSPEGFDRELKDWQLLGREAARFKDARGQLRKRLGRR